MIVNFFEAAKEASDSQLTSVLLGAVIASIVPIVTLLLSTKRWRVEKRVEHLRLKYSQTEKMYEEILARLPEALHARSYPIAMISKISVHASPEVRKLFFDHVEDKEKDELKIKSAHLNIAKAINQHLASIEAETDAALK